MSSDTSTSIGYPSNPTLRVGDVFETSLASTIVRVLAFDEIEVIIDYWLPGLNRWSLGNDKKSASYSRTSTDVFLKSSIRVRHDSLTEFERKLHRPDLPLRMYRTSLISWKDQLGLDREQFTAALASAGVEVGKLQPLAAKTIFVHPCNTDNVTKLGRALEAENGKCLSAIEVLWGAYQVQTSVKKDKTQGIGLYRSGIVRRGLPAYYIGGRHDCGGSTERFEKRLGKGVEMLKR